MAFGTMTLVSSEQVAQGPVFLDRVTLVGNGSYSSGGNTGVKAALQALTKDGRVPYLVVAEDGKGFTVSYDVPTEKLLVYEQDGTGAQAEVSGSQSAFTYKLGIFSK